MPAPKYGKDAFVEAVNTCKNIREVLLKLGICAEGGNYKSFYRSAKRWNVDVSKFEYGPKNRLRKYTDDELKIAVINSQSIYGVLRYLNIDTKSGGIHEKVKLRIKNLNLNTNHFTGQGWSIGKTFGHKRPIEDYFSGKQSITSHKLKLRLIADEIFSHKCCICNLTEWNGKPIPIELDHINGNHDDNSKENLRIMCPNCHAQTDTYCSKNK